MRRRGGLFCSRSVSTSFLGPAYLFSWTLAGFVWFAFRWCLGPSLGCLLVCLFVRLFAYARRCVALPLELPCALVPVVFIRPHAAAFSPLLLLLPSTSLFCVLSRFLLFTGAFLSSGGTKLGAILSARLVCCIGNRVPPTSGLVLCNVDHTLLLR